MTPKKINFFNDEYDDLIGKTFKEAEALYPNMKLRVVEKDGVPYMVTMDYRMDRLNFTIVNGLITKVDLG